MAYQHILFAADFSDEALRIGARAKEIADQNGAQLSFIHVIEDMNVSLCGGYELLPVLPDVPDERLLQEAQQALGEIAHRLAAEHATQWVVSAPSTREGILEAARNHSVDLIVVGSHGRHGLALLLGSTANAVLHGAPCDVLAIRI